MKFIWGKKELTFMIIPGANRRTVRFKLPHSSLYIVPSVLVFVLISFLVTIYVINTRSEQTRNSMQQAFDGQEQQLVEQISDKTSELEQLQIDLIALSQQADEFKVTLEEIKKLDHVLELMSQPEATNGTSKKLSSSHPVNGSKVDIGGSEQPVAPEDVSSLVSATKNGLQALVGDINALLTNLTESEAKIKESEYVRSITPTLWPIASHRISSGFGMRIDPFSFKPSMHTGYDLDGEYNDPVYVTAAGKVRVVGYDAEHGNYIIVDHSRGIETEYMHLNKILVKRGESVTKGQQIGLVGSTGRSTGSHLHYEVHKSGIPIDPKPYLITDRKDERK